MDFTTLYIKYEHENFGRGHIDMYTFCFLTFCSVHVYVAGVSVCCELSTCRYLTRRFMHECYEKDTQTQECNTMEWDRRIYINNKASW